MIKVLLVDDHTVVRAGYRHLLQSATDITIIAEAESGEEAYNLHQKHKPDVTVMDISMPGIGGLEAMRRIIAQNSSARVLIFTMHDDMVFAARALEDGAKGYLSKTCSPEALIEGVRAVAVGRKYLGAEVAQKIAMQGAQGTSEALKTLSAREFEVFTTLAQGVALNEVSERLNLDYKSVVNIQTRIRQKLNIENTAQLVLLAVRAGVVSP